MTQKYFTGLNYTLGNEDSTLEIKLVEHYQSKSLFSVCGSGGRALPLAGPGVTDLTLSDLSQEQINLAMLREATYKQLTHDQFLKFWGYFPYRDDQHISEREELFLKLKISSDVALMFTNIFREISFHSVLYLGKWERTFATLAKINRTVLGRDYDKILTFDNLDQQIDYYRNHFPHFRWKLVLLLLGNKALFNALLYKGDFIEKNSPLSHFEYYHRAFENLFTRDLAKKSFFLQLCFYGKIQSSAGVPVEANLMSHQRIQDSKTNIHYLKADLITHLAEGSGKYDFLSLSDVPSYFRGELEVQFMQKIRPSLIPGAIVVNRYYLRRPECSLEGFVDVTADHLELISDEKVQMYDICVYQYRP